MVTERGTGRRRAAAQREGASRIAMEARVARQESQDLLFRRIGVDLPLSEGSKPFTDEDAPVRGLAVSNRYGISFFVHSAGERKLSLGALLCVED